MHYSESFIKGVWKGFKTIFTRNAILIICVNIIYTYCNNIQSGLRGLVATKELGFPASIIGTAISVSMFMQIVCNSPAGMIADNLRNKIKYFLIATILIELVDILAFNFINNRTGYYFLFFCDGIVDSLATTLIPVVLALMVDRKAMGRAFAIMQGISVAITATAKQAAITTYNNKGLFSALMLAVILLLIAAFLCFLLDDKKISEAKDSRELEHTLAKKKKAGLLLEMIPICLGLTAAHTTFNFDISFMPIYADKYDIPYLDISSVGGIIQGVSGVIVGVLCDFISPAIFLSVGIFGLGACYIGMAMVENVSLVRFSYLMIYLFRNTINIGRILGMQMVSKSEHGAFNGTYATCNGIISTIFSALLGFSIDWFGYMKTLRIMSAWVYCALMLFIGAYLNTIRKQNKKNKTI